MTMTMEPTATPTLAEVEKQEARAEELRTKAGETAARVRELTAAIAEAHADGREEDAEALAVERREAADLLRDVEAALPVLEERISERREAAARAEAARRLLAISRAHGSARASYREDVVRIETKAAELEEAVQRAEARYGTLGTLEAEALALLDRFEDLDPPAIERALPPADQEPAVKALARAAELRLSRGEQLPRRLADVDGRTARRLLQRVKGTPTAEILDAAPGEWTVEAHDARHRATSEENRERKNAERRAEVEAVDEWLRGLLADGPVRHERVIEAAQQQGIAIVGVHGAGEACVSGARRRLDVRVVHPIVERKSSRIGSRLVRGVDNSIDLWALPNGWEAEEYG